MNLKIPFLFLISIFFSFSGKSIDVHKDSIFALNELAWKHLHNNLDSSEFFANCALDYSIRVNDIDGEMTARSYLSKVFRKRVEFDSAFYHLNLVIEYDYRASDTMRFQYDLMDLAQLYEVMGDYPKRLELQFLELNLSQMTQDTVGFIRGLGHISSTYSYIKDREKAKEYAERSLELQYAFDIHEFGSVCFSILARYYESKEDFRKSLYYDQMAFEADAPFIQNKYGAVPAGNLGHDYYNLEVFDSAKIFFHKGMELGLRTSDKAVQMIGICNYVMILTELDEIDSAKFYFARAKEIFDQSVDPLSQLKFHTRGASLFQLTGETGKANYYLRKQQKIKDSLYSAEQYLKIARTEFKLEKLELEQEIIQAKNEKLALKIVQATRLNWIFAISSLVLVLSGLFFIRLFRKNLNIKKNNLELNQSKLEMEQRVLHAQMSPHFIFNVLNSIQALVFKKDTQSASLLISKFSRLLRSVLNNTSKEFNTIQETIDLIEKYAEIENYRLEVKADLLVNIGDLEGESKIKIVSFILQPLVENCFKHGFDETILNPAIKIRIQRVSDYIKMEIYDNGVGYEKSNDKDSKGIDLVRDRINLVDNRNSLEISNNNSLESVLGSGTTVTITYYLSE